MTAAVREGHVEIFEMLLKAGASQACCEEALLDASCHGRGGKFIELLMASDFIRPHIAVHALVNVCCRGFVDVVEDLLKVKKNISNFFKKLICKISCTFSKAKFNKYNYTLFIWFIPTKIFFSLFSCSHRDILLFKKNIT